MNIDSEFPTDTPVLDYYGITVGKMLSDFMWHSVTNRKL